MRTAFRADDSTKDRPSDLFSSSIHFLLQIPSIQNTTAEMKLKTELSPKLFYQVYAAICLVRVCQICVQPPMQMIPPKMLLIFFSMTFTSHRRFLLSRPYFLFRIFHFLQHNQHMFFFQRNFTRVITCLIAKIDHQFKVGHFQGRSFSRSVYCYSNTTLVVVQRTGHTPEVKIGSVLAPTPTGNKMSEHIKYAVVFYRSKKIIVLTCFVFHI